LPEFVEGRYSKVREGWARSSHPRLGRCSHCPGGGSAQDAETLAHANSGEDILQVRSDNGIKPGHLYTVTYVRYATNFRTQLRGAALRFGWPGTGSRVSVNAVPPCFGSERFYELRHYGVLGSSPRRIHREFICVRYGIGGVGLLPSEQLLLPSRVARSFPRGPPFALTSIHPSA
jgi:hypothetical protein